MSDNQLKPCPFCGGVSVAVPWQQDVFNDRYYVQCQSCNVRTPSYRTAPEAIAAWNRRASGWLPIETSVPIEHQIDAVESCARRDDLWGDELEAALETLRWVQSHWQPLPQPPKE